MRKKTMMLSCIAACAIVSGYVGMKAYESHAEDVNNLIMENVEALSQDGDNSDRDWFAALRPEECTLKKINLGGAFYYKGFLIPAGGSYSVMGTRMACTFNLFNTCDVSKQTLCIENKTEN